MADIATILATGGVGVVSALAGIVVGDVLTSRRERRAYLRSQREARIERYRSEYLATLRTFSTSLSAAVALIYTGLKPIDESMEKMDVKELLNAKLRLALLPAPPRIVSALEDAFAAMTYPYTIAPRESTPDEVARRVQEMSAKLTTEMQQHLEELEASKTNGG